MELEEDDIFIMITLADDKWLSLCPNTNPERIQGGKRGEMVVHKNQLEQACGDASAHQILPIKISHVVAIILQARWYLATLGT